MNVCVVGGTGFIGYHTILKLLEKGHTVKAVAAPNESVGDWFPSEVDLRFIDVFGGSENILKDLFKGIDGIVYALGPDDRKKPKEDAYSYFHRYLVDKFARILEIARDSGVKKAVICNSYFAYFDRIHPEWHLAEHHPYIRARVEQGKKALEIGGDKMDVMVLELPYIFGVHPVQVPLWKDHIIDRIKEPGDTFYYFKGGSNMISVENVVDAIIGALERGKGRKYYVIGDQNLDWITWLRIMMDEMGIKKKIRIVPKIMLGPIAKKIRKQELEEGVDAGLAALHYFKDIQIRELYFDPTESQKELGYHGGGLEEAIRKTVRRCMELDEKESPAS